MSAEITEPTPRRRGRRPSCSPDLAIRVIRMRRQGMSYTEISVALNREGTPTPDGRPVWQKFHVEHLLHTMHVRDLAEALDAN